MRTPGWAGRPGGSSVTKGDKLAKGKRKQQQSQARVRVIVACQQPGDVTVFTSDVDDMEKLLPPTVLVKKV